MDSQFVIMVIGLAVAGVIGAVTWYHSDAQRMRRALRAAARVAIAEVREGAVVKIVGEVRPEAGVVVSPLTRRECVYYDVTVDERVSAGKSSYWKRILREHRGVPFRVEDGTGVAVVDSATCEILLEMDSTSQSGVLDDATRVEEEFLRRNGVDGVGWVFNRTLRYSEGVLSVGERAAVLGRGVREANPEAQSRVTGYRSDLPTRVRLVGSDAEPLRISDEKKLTGI